MVLIVKPQQRKIKTKKSTKKTEKGDVGSPKPVAPKPQKEIVSDDKAIQTIEEKYPILKDEGLVQRFLSVSLTNNQKGRIRQNLKDSLKNTAKTLVPDIINNQIQNIVSSTRNLSDSDLRKIRILYNMLKTASLEEIMEDAAVKSIKTDKKQDSKKRKISESDTPKPEKVKKVKKVKDVAKNESNEIEKTEENSNKPNVKSTPKGVKRYVVFVGNLPVEITKEMIMDHFRDLASQIKDIRIPKQGDGKKSAIAYVELKNEPSYELALSKHHTMLGTKRINVLYSTQKNSKISKTEAKSKSAKLQALQKSGQLIGSLPLNRKRSQRRKKQRAARAKENKDV